MLNSPLGIAIPKILAIFAALLNINPNILHLMEINMHSRILNCVNRMKPFLLVALLCLGMSDIIWAKAFPPTVEKVNGILYVLGSNVDSPVTNVFLNDLRFIGFSVNPKDEETYIAPDGRIVPKFSSAWIVCSANFNSATPASIPSDYSGHIYLLDSIARNHPDQKYSYVLDFNSEAMAERVISIRTPKYAKICLGDFRNAVNLRKAQLGTCYAVEPYAFMNCAKLETLVFEKSPYVYDNAFTDCAGIKTVVLQSGKELPYVEAPSAFEESVYEKATLYLPDDLMDECGQDPVWSRFVRRKSVKEYQLGVLVSTLIDKLFQQTK